MQHNKIYNQNTDQKNSRRTRTSATIPQTPSEIHKTTIVLNKKIIKKKYKIEMRKIKFTVQQHNIRS